MFSARCSWWKVAQRMDLGSFKAYNSENDPNRRHDRQYEYTSKVNWTGGRMTASRAGQYLERVSETIE